MKRPIGSDGAQSDVGGNATVRSQLKRRSPSEANGQSHAWLHDIQALKSSPIVFRIGGCCPADDVQEHTGHNLDRRPAKDPRRAREKRDDALPPWHK